MENGLPEGVFPGRDGRGFGMIDLGAGAHAGITVENARPGEDQVGSAGGRGMAAQGSGVSRGDTGFGHTGRAVSPPVLRDDPERLTTVICDIALIRALFFDSPGGGE